MKVIFIQCLCAILLGYSAFCQVTFLEKSNELNIVDPGFNVGAGIIDLNDDGINEIVVITYQGQNRLYMWNDSLYQNVAVEYGIAQSIEHQNITVADLDKDYNPDLYITSHLPLPDARYYYNPGFPPFIDIAQQLGIDTVYSTGSTFFQLTPETGISGLFGGILKTYDFNNCTFINITQGSGLVNLTNVFTPLFFDMDGDIDADLFIAGNWVLNTGRLYRNNGDSTFTDFSNNTNQYGFPVGQYASIGDIDNDGDFDIYFCSGFGVNSMWENDGTGYFTNITGQSNTGVDGYTRGSSFGDFDNDGDLDLFLCRGTSYDMLLLNDGTGIFSDYSYQAGVNSTLNSFCCSIGDLNNDGQLDIVATNCDYNPPLIYINQNQNTSFIKVKVRGQFKNTLALGTVIKLYGITDIPADTVLIGTRQIASLTTLCSFNELTAHFGTATYDNLWVHVTFPSYDEVDIFDVIPGQTVFVVETPTGIEQPQVEKPSRFFLVDAYPNPFNNSVNLHVTGVTGDGCIMKIYDLLGRLVKSANINQVDQNAINYTWDGRNNLGESVPSGVYLVKITDGQYVVNTKITLLK